LLNLTISTFLTPGLSDPPTPGLGPDGPLGHARVEFWARVREAAELLHFYHFFPKKRRETCGAQTAEGIEPKLGGRVGTLPGTSHETSFGRGFAKRASRSTFPEIYLFIFFAIF